MATDNTRKKIQGVMTTRKFRGHGNRQHPQENPGGHGNRQHPQKNPGGHGNRQHQQENPGIYDDGSQGVPAQRH